MKHLIDNSMAGVALVILWPIILFVGLVVRQQLGAPVLFRQTRAGLGGKPFILVKFRSMLNATGPDGRMLPDADRLTRFGIRLRATRLDELPELWNILKGEMSFVGPRPLLPETLAGFGEFGRKRGTVRPGLTGWAQVNGNTLLDDRSKLALDIWYIDHLSLWLDLVIILKTIATVVRGERIERGNLEKALAHAYGPDRCS
jgi:lipopolysaccharide/colanic/teichoic acid biosynthesis glycosyltransferase